MKTSERVLKAIVAASIIVNAFIGLLICQVSDVYAQGVGINSSGNSPDPSAILDASSFNKGALIPRMTAAQRDAITNPAVGLVIFNTDCNTFNYNAGNPSSPNWAMVNASNVLIPGVSISANPAATICTGTTVTFTAISTNGGASPTYQWKLNGASVGINNSTYVTSSLSNGDIVTCELTSNAICVSGSPVMSNSVPITVLSTPVISGTVSGSNAACLNSTGNVYSVNPVAGATAYYWLVPAGAFITSGAGSASITVTFGSASGNVNVTASNSCGSSSQINHAVTVYAMPVSTFTATTGLTNIAVTFSPTITGAAFNWTFAGGTPASSTAQSPVVTWNTAGTYNVSLTVTQNGCSSTTSDSILISNPSSCLAIKTAYASASSGNYTIYPSGNTTTCYCDMVTDGGGWTMVYNNQFNGNEGGPTPTQTASVYGTPGINSDFGINGQLLYSQIGATQMLLTEQGNWIKFSTLSPTQFNNIWNQTAGGCGVTYSVVSMNGNTYNRKYDCQYINSSYGNVEFNTAWDTNNIFEFNWLLGARDTNHYWHIWPNADGTYALQNGVTGLRWGAILIR